MFFGFHPFFNSNLFSRPVDIQLADSGVAVGEREERMWSVGRVARREVTGHITLDRTVYREISCAFDYTQLSYISINQKSLYRSETDARGK